MAYLSSCRESCNQMFVTHFLDLNAAARVEKSKNRNKLIGFMIIHIIFAYTKVFCRGGFIVGVG